ncbi:MAG: 3-phenylpropionate/cinnamic acid dioxygenase subunit beta [Burkholderiales bacterium]|nr:3-phenylpropionate/cinnamic acid dioxygenase subunit beta [Burkholderiales bacterium]ODU71785.1 MAG: hypothetical protein ABT05_00910 [Lautropia sp. SCN 66-9]
MSELELWFDVNRFLFREASLLDDRRFRDWLKLFTDDVVYWAPMLSNRVGKDMRYERSRYGEMAHFEEDKRSLTGRVERMETGMAWAESPPSRTRHLVSNVEVTLTKKADEIKVRSAFLVYRTHMETDEEIYGGCREDLLRGSPGKWQIARRTIVIDQAVTLGKNLAIFF